MHLGQTLDVNNGHPKQHVHDYTSRYVTKKVTKSELKWTSACTENILKALLVILPVTSSKVRELHRALETNDRPQEQNQLIFCELLCEGPRFESASALFSSAVVVCGHCLATLSLTINETLKWLSSLLILLRKSFW